jgi:flagellar protein FlbD
MVCLTRLNGVEVFVNPDLIRLIEKRPDTLLTFTDGQQLMVKDRPEEIVKKIIEFRKSFMSGVISPGN